MNSPMIFVTHSSHDAVTAIKIRDYLESNGIQCWMAPRDIPIGEEWAKGILNGINTALGMLLVFSSNSNDSSQVRREIERAIHNNIPIYPVRIEDVQPSDAMEYYISSNHWMDAFGGNFETNLDKLVAAIKSKHNITSESKSELTSKPVQSKEQSPTQTSQVTDKSFKRKLAFPKLSFKISKKILFPIVFLPLLVAGYFISKSFKNSNPDTTTAEVIAPLPSDTINTFVRMIASTDEFNDYVAGIKVTEDGNYVIMGYSYVNDDYDGKPWIAMFDSIGNEMWKHEGPINASDKGAFDIFPDGRSVWAYPLSDSTLTLNLGETLYTKEFLSNDGEVIVSETSVITNANGFFGRKTSIATHSMGVIRDVLVDSTTVFIKTCSYFGICSELVEDTYVVSVEEKFSVENSFVASTSNVATIEFELDQDSFTESDIEIEYHDLLSVTSKIVIDDERIYSFDINPFVNPFLLTFNIVSRCWNESNSLPQHETLSKTFSLFQNTTYIPLDNFPILVSNCDESFFLISLFPDNNFHCIKVDKIGNEIWYNTFGTPTSNDVLCGAAVFNEILYLYGSAYSIDDNSMDGFLEAVNQDGEVLFQNYYDLGGNEQIVGVEEILDDGFVFVMESSVGGTSDIYLVKVDSLNESLRYEPSHNDIVYENWGSYNAISQVWFGGRNGNWHISDQVMSSNDSLGSLRISIRNDVAIFMDPFFAQQSYAYCVDMGVLGYVPNSSDSYLRFGFFSDEEFAGNRLYCGSKNSVKFKSLYKYEEDSRIYNEEDIFLHWDCGENTNFETCGRIGAGYFNGDSIVVGRVEPDTAWVEYGVLNDFEIKVDGNSADYFINDSLFFHTDEFVCNSDSLYLYLGGASSTIPNAIGEVRVTSE